MNASTAWLEPYRAYEMPGDRLGRWMVLGAPGPRSSPVVAENLGTEAVAKLFASAPAMRDKLAKIQTLVDVPNIGTLTSPALIAAISAILSEP
jgi:hypothetical protein